LTYDMLNPGAPAGGWAVYTGGRQRHLAMPLGGSARGVALCGNGSLRQWQLHNIGNHAGHLLDSFFAIRACRVEPVPCQNRSHGA
jgi:hypothetical protein